MTWKPVLSAFLFFVVLFVSPLIHSQSTSASLTGLIDDPQRAVITGASVTAINTETGVKTSTKSNNSGQYVLPDLPPGHYRLEVDHAGFKGIIEAGLTLHVQDVVQINFHMAVGSASETVSVSASDIQINKTDGTVSTVVDAEMVKNMPLNGRSFQDLILLTPGVVQPFGGTNGQNGEFSVNGQRTEENYYTVDGVSANVNMSLNLGTTSGGGPSGSVAAATAVGSTQALVSVDDLQEFRVQSSTYSAEYGRNPGAQISFETKSGTKQWHGTADDYLRNNYFDANNWFNDYHKQKEPPLRQNDFGGTLGGPLRVPRLGTGKDRTFFFFSYEGLRLLAPQPSTVASVPDAALRANTVAPLNAVLNAFPIPSSASIGAVDDTVNGVGQFIGTWSNPSKIDSSSIRLDENIGEKHRVFFRFSDTPSDSNRYVPSEPSEDSYQSYRLRTYTLGEESSFPTGLNNSLRLNRSTNRTSGGSSLDTVGGAVPLDFPKLTGLSSNSAFTVYPIEYSGYFVFLTVAKNRAEQQQWSLVDTVTYVRGRHQLRFGADYRRLTPFQAPFNPLVEWEYETSASEVEANEPDSSDIRSKIAAYPLYQNFSLFAQDELKASRRLNLSIGLRWDVNPAPGVTKGLFPYTVDSSSADHNNWALAPEGTSLWKTTWYNVAPRLGAAYVVHETPGWETVLRGGGGLFFDSGQQLGSYSFTNPGTFSPFAFTRPGLVFPEVATPPVIQNPPTGHQSTLWGFEPHLQLPYTLEWSVSLEQALSSSQSVTASYVASRAARLLKQTAFSTTNNPNASNFILFENGLTSSYEAAQIQYQHRFSRVVSALGSYTWSHCLDFGSGNAGFLAYQRGNCDYDLRQNLATALSYDIPAIGGGRVVRGVLSHWGIDNRFTARTAFPLGINGSNTINKVTGETVSTGVNLVSGVPLYLFGAQCEHILGPTSQGGIGDLAPGFPCPGGRAVDPCAFVAIGKSQSAPCTAAGLGGTGEALAPRNFVRGFDAVQMDMAVRRQFPIYERLALQFRGEAFNIFNHPNFGGINTSVGNNTFGQANATLNNSLGVLNSLYQMGGPRSMQFALRLIF